MVSEKIDIHRKELHLTGTPHDINRVAQACIDALRSFANEGTDFNQQYTVVVQPPQTDEP